VQKYSGKSKGNKEKTPEFWVWRKKKRCFLCEMCNFAGGKTRNVMSKNTQQMIQIIANSSGLSDIEIMEL